MKPIGWQDVADPLRVATGLVLAFIYMPLVVIVLYAFNAEPDSGLAPDGFTLDWYVKAFENAAIRQVVPDVVQARSARRSSRWSSARCDPGGPALSLLRSRDVSFLVILPIALPGIVTGMALNTTFRTFGARLRPVHDHRRPRHVLHRDRLQQRDRPPATHGAIARGGVDGPRRGHLPDIPARDVPGHRHGAGRRRPARVRAVVRRDHRHDLHGRAGTQTLPIWIFQQLPAGPIRFPLVNVASVIVHPAVGRSRSTSRSASAPVGGVAAAGSRIRATARLAPMRSTRAGADHSVRHASGSQRRRRPGYHETATTAIGDRHGEDTARTDACGTSAGRSPARFRRPTPPRSARSETADARVSRRALSCDLSRSARAGRAGSSHRRFVVRVTGTCSGSSLKSSRQPLPQNQ